jgi:hypothetical protein
LVSAWLNVLLHQSEWISWPNWPNCRLVKTVPDRYTLLLSIPVICCLQIGHETAESFPHNHSLDVTLWSCNTRN